MSSKTIIKNSRNRLTYVFALLPIFLTNLLVSLSSKGPLEGEQFGLDLNERYDWWGWMPPILYGQWPGGQESLELFLPIIQLLAFSVGFLLLLNKKLSKLIDLNRLGKVFLSLMFFFGGMFSMQLWRDSTLFAFFILGAGLSKMAKSSNLYAQKIIFCFGLMVSIISLSIRYFLAPPLFILWLILVFGMPDKRPRKIHVMILFSILALPIVLHVTIKISADLKNSYPEQQPMIYDLSSIYCWGSNQGFPLAEKAVKNFVKSDFPVEATCASLEPIGWDTLYKPRPQWEYAAPVIPIRSKSEYRQLRNLWIQNIVNSPSEYMQVKILFSSQVLFMANAIGPRELKVNQNLLESITNSIFFVAKLVDRVRLFSFFTIYLLLFILVFQEKFEIHLTSSIWKNLTPLVIVFLITTLLFSLSTISYVANNGRYVFPGIFLILFVLYNMQVERFKSTKESKNSKV